MLFTSNDIYKNTFKQILKYDLFLGPALSWTSPLKDIKILCTHVAIYKLTAAVKKYIYIYT